MPKQKQNANPKEPKSIKKIIWIAISVIIFLLVGSWVTQSLTRHFEAQKQKADLVGSLEVIKSIYEEQVRINSVHVESKTAPENRCFRIGSKSLTPTYSCGTRSSIDLSKITEVDADKATATFISSMSQTTGLTRVRVGSAYESSIENRKTTSLDAFYAETDINCHGTSTYMRDEQRLILSFGCTDRDKFQPFALLN